MLETTDDKLETKRLHMQSCAVDSKTEGQIGYHALTDAIWLVCPRFVRYGRLKGNKPTKVLFRVRFLLVPGKTKFGIM